MAPVLIRDNDQLLIHRDGVDYKTPWTTVLATLPEVTLDGVLVYKGVAAGNSTAPDQVAGEIWLLDLGSGTPAAWVPEGAKHGDYLTWAADVDGGEAWRLIGNAAGVDFELYATKDEVQAVYDDLAARLDDKASGSDLSNLSEQVEKNTELIGGLQQTTHLNAGKIQSLELGQAAIEERVGKNETDIEELKNSGTEIDNRLALIDSSLEHLHGTTNDLGEAVKGLTVAVTQQGGEIKILEKVVEGNKDLIDANTEAINALQAAEGFDFASLELLPA